MRALNATHDPGLRSWVESANRAAGDFPIQNLPFGVFRRRAAGPGEPFRGGVAIGDEILDLASEELRGLASGSPVEAALAACGESTLNSFMGLGPQAWSSLRQFLSEHLREGSPHVSRLRATLVDRKSVV